MATGVRLVVLMLSPCVFSRVTVTAPTSCRSPGARLGGHAGVMTAHLLRPHPVLQIIIIIDLLREINVQPEPRIDTSNEPTQRHHPKRRHTWRLW